MKYRLLSWTNDLWYSNFRILASLVCYCIAFILFSAKIYNLSRKLCAMSLRYGVRPPAVFLYKKILNVNPYSLADVSCGVSIDEAALRSIVVKWPVYTGEKIEKGVIVVTFTKTFSYYIRSINLPEMQKHFCLVLEPSWSGYADPDIFFFYTKHNDVVISCSEIEDRILLNCFRETFIPVTFGASDWVDYRRFSPLKVDKVYDSIYIANTKPIKRVKRYLDAVRNIVDSGLSEYKALLVCASWGGGELLVKDLVSRYSLENNIELKFSLGMNDLIHCLCKSKVNVLLSYKEGSNRSLFEAIFCDVPVICLSENVGVNKSYINECTGMLIPDLFLEQALIWASRNSGKFTPRAWAMNNISPEVSTSKLAGALHLEAMDDAVGPMLVKTNNPEVSYFDYPDVQHKQYTKSVLELFDSRETKPSRVYSEQILEIKKSFDVAISR
jgi:hypothetical protein